MTQVLNRETDMNRISNRMENLINIKYKIIKIKRLTIHQLNLNTLQSK